MEAILGVIVGFIAFGIIWFFLLKPKKDELPTDELKIKEEELKKSQIDLARREEEIKAAVEAKQNLTNQLEEKKGEVKDLYGKVDEITKGVTEYKSISEKAINKHDEAIARHTNWWEKLTTNITYQGKFNQEILENLLTSANLVKDRDFFPQKKQTTYDIDDNKDKDVIPDMLLKFPERNYIVDAKVSLTHWTKYINERDENKKKQYLKDHLASVRNHLFGPKGLVKKNYNKLYGIKSLQSVIVFFPATNLYSITLDADKTLQTEALKANFILSSPTDLLNMIKVFEQIKSEKKQIENISKIITSASKIFDKYSDVKTAIKGALQSYKTHANQLQNIVTKSWGSQGLEKQIKKLEDEHGVMPGKQIPEIPAEQSNIADVADPEEEKDKLN
ncbi:DNA recombination protein RmuC [Candidatus Pelagibacter sp.]|uniref:DNA recombination protein RmuC n=1 Tax=Candidatus Pelagibacter sp. TaxID=2024849 RepID=UPI003F87535E